jgi:hypothetical protein
MAKAPEDLTGRSFGRLRADERDFVKEASSIKRQSWWKCTCECGEKKTIRASFLIGGHALSCGCGRTKHGHSKKGNISVEYKTWDSMLRRCFNSSDVSYKNYGGRGITVCERWKRFINFYEDMGDKPKGMSLDRVNNNGNYEPSNCRWSTRSQQNRNMRTTKLTEKKVQRIREFRWAGSSLRVLGKLFGVHGMTIFNIVHGKKWPKDMKTSDGVALD